MADKKTGATPKLEALGGAAVMCKHKGCKHSLSKFGFCKEHFEQFKFGLINKNGELVPDWEKKWDQFKKTA